MITIFFYISSTSRMTVVAPWLLKLTLDLNGSMIVVSKSQFLSNFTITNGVYKRSIINVETRLYIVVSLTMYYLTYFAKGCGNLVKLIKKIVY